MRRGLLLSHLLASTLGGLILAAILLGFGVIGKQRTETVPINLSAPQIQAAGNGTSSNVTEIYRRAASGVVLVRTKITRRVPSPFLATAAFPHPPISSDPPQEQAATDTSRHLSPRTVSNMIHHLS